jgi:hypothetical protein
MEHGEKQLAAGRKRTTKGWNEAEKGRQGTRREERELNIQPIAGYRNYYFKTFSRTC